jgi:hypothetical protein
MRVMLVVLAWVIGISCALAQSDTVRHDEKDITNPESKYNKELPKDIGPQRDSVRLEGNQIPRKLRRTLNRDDLYRGWEHEGVYLNKNTKLYMLYISTDSLTRKYGFDEQGKVVTFTSFIKP